jgi:hypothetical protein
MKENNKDINGKGTAALETPAAAGQGLSLTPFFGWTSIVLSAASFAVVMAMLFTSAPEDFGTGIERFLLSCLIDVISVFVGVIGLNRKEPPKYSTVGIITGLLLLTWFAVGKW